MNIKVLALRKVIKGDTRLKGIAQILINDNYEEVIFHVACGNTPYRMRKQ